MSDSRKIRVTRVKKKYRKIARKRREKEEQTGTTSRRLSSRDGKGLKKHLGRDRNEPCPHWKGARQRTEASKKRNGRANEAKRTPSGGQSRGGMEKADKRQPEAMSAQ